MGARDPDFEEWVREHFAALGPLEIKRMFGGAGVYRQGIIFALLDDGVVWLKGDETNIPALEAAGFLLLWRGGYCVLSVCNKNSIRGTKASQPAVASGAKPEPEPARRQG